MDLKFVVPKMEETFGELEFAGEGEVSIQRVNGRTNVASRSYHLYSSRQRADDIVVVVSGAAGEKRFAYEEKVKLVNPRIGTEGKNINGRGYTDYILYADDIVKAE